MGFWKRDKQNKDNQQEIRQERLQQDLVQAQKFQSLNKLPKQPSKEAHQKQQTDEEILKCPFSGLSPQNATAPRPRNRPYRVRNLLDSSEAVDTLHLNGDVSLIAKQMFKNVLERC